MPSKVAVLLCMATILCVGICIFVVLTLIFLGLGGAIIDGQNYCVPFYFGTEEPNPLTLPDLRNLSQSEDKSLREGSYKLSNEYNLKMTQDYLGPIKLCILKRYHTRVSACIEIGTNLEEVVICGPGMRPDCLSGSIVDYYFGASLWYQNDSTVEYIILDIDSSIIYGRELTNTTTTLSVVWYYVLSCDTITNIAISAIFFGILTFICCVAPCLGCALFCCWATCPDCKRKCADTPTVSYEQLRKQEQDDELTLINQEETEGSCSERSFEVMEEYRVEDAVSLNPSEQHQDGSHVSSSEEEDLQVQPYTSGQVSSGEIAFISVSKERGHRRRGHRSRVVTANRPMAGYFTDSTSMSGAATDVSTNDASASDEESNEESDVHAQLSSSSSSVTMLIQEATRVDTPPPYAGFHPNTVYEHRPGVTAEPRQPPDGN